MTATIDMRHLVAKQSSAERRAVVVPIARFDRRAIAAIHHAQCIPAVELVPAHEGAWGSRRAGERARVEVGGIELGMLIGATRSPTSKYIC